MRYRVEIVDEPKYEVMVDSMPKAKMGAQVNYSLYNKLASMGGADMEMSAPDRKATQTITKVPRKAANLEAEGGETVLTFDPVGYPLFYKIKGPRHHSGGVPLNLPDDSFIFSDTKEMIIRDCTILKMFNKACNKKGFTPADLSKQFDINTYRNTLQDPNTDEITRKTAESMIKKYVVKLGALALAQEAKKGFPQGIPVVAKAYMEAYGISEGDIMPELAEEEQQMPQQQGQGQMSPIDQMPPDQYAQEPQPEGAQYTQGDEMGQQAPVPEGMASPEMVEPMMQQAQQQMPPMAMYGMSMGGFYPEYAFGGMPMYPGGGEFVKGKSGNVSAERKNKADFDSDKGTVTTTNTGKKAKYSSEAGAIREYDPKKEFWYGKKPPKNTNTGGYDAAGIQSLCDRLMKGATIDTLVENGFGIKEELTKLLAHCIPAADEKFKETERAIYMDEEPPPPGDCPVCIDPITGKEVTTGPDGQPFKRVKDEQGNCTPCPTKGCYCEDEMGKEIEVDCNDPCLKEEQVESRSASYDPEVPFKSQSIDPMWADANMNPEYIGERRPQLELYGIDARPEANQAMAGANAIMQAQSKFTSSPGALLGNQLAGQAAASDITNAAYAAANKFNTNQRNDEIKINTNYRDELLKVIPAAARQYLGEVAMQKENAARFWNEKQAKNVERRDAKTKYDTEMNWVLANNENVKWAPDRGFYSRKTRDFTPNAPKSDMLSRTKQVMSEGIEDANTAYKIAKDMESRLGGAIYANGGFIYTDNIFPYLI